MYKRQEHRFNGADQYLTSLESRNVGLNFYVGIYGNVSEYVREYAEKYGTRFDGLSLDTVHQFHSPILPRYCEKDSQCPPEAPYKNIDGSTGIAPRWYCDKRTHQCAPDITCRKDIDCLPNYRCNDKTHECEPIPCSTNEDCMLYDTTGKEGMMYHGYIIMHRGIAYPGTYYQVFYATECVNGYCIRECKDHGGCYNYEPS